MELNWDHCIICQKDTAEPLKCPLTQASGQPVPKQSKRYPLHRTMDGPRNWSRGCQFGQLFPRSPEHAESLSNALVKGTALPANAAKPIWTAHHFASATV